MRAAMNPVLFKFPSSHSRSGTSLAGDSLDQRRVWCEPGSIDDAQAGTRSTNLATPGRLTCRAMNHEDHVTLAVFTDRDARSSPLSGFLLATGQPAPTGSGFPTTFPTSGRTTGTLMPILSKPCRAPLSLSLGEFCHPTNFRKRFQAVGSSPVVHFFHRGGSSNGGHQA